MAIILKDQGGGGANETLPEQASNFYAVPASDTINITWTNPTEYFSGVKIVKKLSGYPTSVRDGELIYNGNAETYVDNDVVEDTDYYYRIFAYNSKGQIQTLEEVATAKILSLDTQYFGDGSDGNFVLGENETHVEEVPVEDESIVIKQYQTFTMDVGSSFTCDKRNAGLIIRVRGDCTINGTIDQTAKSPKPNPDNNYAYPTELICGNGGRGGNCTQDWNYSDGGSGGAGMVAHVSGGGWSGGGGGGGSENDGGDGGGVNTITIATTQALFVGGARGGDRDDGGPGRLGGGGAGSAHSSNNSADDDDYGMGGVGGSGAGGNGGNGSNYGDGGGCGGGGAGNIGGGVILIYVGGNLTIVGNVKSNGGRGGNGGFFGGGSTSRSGASGGGAGGGAVYIVHNLSYLNTGLVQVNGGGVGAGAGVGIAGTAGTITVKTYEELLA